MPQGCYAVQEVAETLRESGVVLAAAAKRSGATGRNPQAATGKIVASLSFPRLAKRLEAIGLNGRSKTMARNSSRDAGTSSQLRFNTYVARIAAL
jgi:hypothetical protein